VEQLVKFFPATGDDPNLRGLYNRAVAHVMDGIREFLVVHYKGAARNDTQYWKDTKTRPAPAELNERIEFWRTRLPDSETVFPYYHGLPPYSYMCVLLGTGGVDLRPTPALKLMDDSAARKEFERVRDRARSLVNTLPSQHEYFAQFR
jgi:tryptophan 6-halogenase